MLVILVVVPRVWFCVGPIAQIKHQSGTWGLAAPESGGILHGAQLAWPLGRAHCSRSSPRVTWGPGGSPGHSWVAWLCSNSGFSGSAGPSADKHSANGFIMHCWTPITPTTKHATATTGRHRIHSRSLPCSPHGMLPQPKGIGMDLLGHDDSCSCDTGSSASWPPTFIHCKYIHMTLWWWVVSL